MEKINKYTETEILSKISRLEDMIDIRKKEKTVISKDINELKKQVIYWQDMSTGQTKLF